VKDLYPALIQELRLAMYDKRVSQGAVAAQAGIRRETVNAYLSGATQTGLPVPVLIAASEVLGVGPDELFRRAMERVSRG
jgi:transcriptional regulator with XRE-family HTH domain